MRRVVDSPNDKAVGHSPQRQHARILVLPERPTRVALKGEDRLAMAVGAACADRVDKAQHWSVRYGL
jgi:hypothetical protein